MSDNAVFKHIFMKSSIKIDLDIDNTPILVISYDPSDDLRDTAVGNLFQELLKKGNLLVGQFNDYGLEEEPKKLKLRPLVKEKDSLMVLENLDLNSWGRCLELLKEASEEYEADSMYDVKHRMYYSYVGGKFTLGFDDKSSEDFSTSQFINSKDHYIKAFIKQQYDKLLLGAALTTKEQE